ncbi:MAG: hypothetical protein ACJ8GN_09270 [Longimicrobiaceae bacterium]
MSKSVELSDSVYAALEATASASGTTPAEWIAAKLPQPAPEPEPRCEEAPHTLADEFGDYIGMFSSGCGDLSERVSEIYGEGVLEKHRARQR